MGDDQNRGPLEKAVEVCVLAPLGLIADASTVVPELVERGRGQVSQARAVGRFTVDKAGEALGGKAREAGRLGLQALRRIAAQGSEEAGAEAPAGTGAGSAAPSGSEGSTDVDGSVGVDSAAPPRPDLRPVPDPAPRSEVAESSSHLAIPDYDSLSASQVVPRLESLGPDELEAVRAYEAASRARKTILGRISQLQQPAG